jgi:hypothetical protein
METLIHADIFFFITSIAVILLTVLLIIALFYFIQILRNFRDISEIFKRGVSNASKSLEELSEKILNNALFKFFFSKDRRKAKSRKKEE